MQDAGDGCLAGGYARGFGADQLEAIGVLLLRHGATARREGVRKTHEPELLRGEQDELRAHLAHVKSDVGERLHVFESEIAGGGGIEAVGEWSGKAKLG